MLFFSPEIPIENSNQNQLKQTQEHFTKQTILSSKFSDFLVYKLLELTFSIKCRTFFNIMYQLIKTMFL